MLFLNIRFGSPAEAKALTRTGTNATAIANFILVPILDISFLNFICNYLVSERKLGFFVKIKEDQNFNRRNTLSILRIKTFI